MRAAKNSGFFQMDQLKTILPEATLDEMIEVIIAENCKVLVTDFALSNEQLGVQYDGNQLIEEMKLRFEDFPCFLTTNLPGDAVGKTTDVNLIYPKEDYLDPDVLHTTKLTFFERVKLSISDYEARFSKKSERFDQLHRTSEARELHLDEAQELLDLDGFLERALSKPSAVPMIEKERAIEPFADLIAKTTELVDEIEAELAKKAEK